MGFALTSKTISWKYTKLLRFFKDTDRREEVKRRKIVLAARPDGWNDVKSFGVPVHSVLELHGGQGVYGPAPLSSCQQLTKVSGRVGTAEKLVTGFDRPTVFAKGYLKKKIFTFKLATTARLQTWKYSLKIGVSLVLF